MVQLGALALSPILTRLYDPAHFGVLALVMIGAGLLAMIGTLRLEYAVIIPADESEGEKIVRTAFAFLIGTAAVAALLSRFPRPDRWTESPMLRWADAGIVIGMMMGLYQLSFQYQIRRKAYRRAAIAQAIAGLGYPLIAILYGWLGEASPRGLLYGMAGAYAAATIFVMPWAVLFTGSLPLPRRSVLAQFRNFPVFNLPHALLNFGSANLPYLMIAGPFGKAAVGQVSMAIGKVFKGIQWWSGSLYPVLSREVMACIHDRKPALPLVRRLIRRQVWYGVPLFAVLGLISPWLFGWFFGPQWKVAGHYLRFLLPWLFMVFVTGPLSFIPNLLGRQKAALGWEIFSLSLRLGGIGAGIALGTVEAALAGYSVAGVISLGLLFRWYLRLLDGQDHASEARHP